MHGIDVPHTMEPLQNFIEQNALEICTAGIGFVHHLAIVPVQAVATPHGVAYVIFSATCTAVASGTIVHIVKLGINHFYKKITK